VARAAAEVSATATTAGAPAFVAFAAGRDVLVAGRDGTGRRVVARLSRSGRLDDLTLSRDGRRLAISTTRSGGRASLASVRTADLVGGGPLRLLDRGGWNDAVRWSPDGSRVLLVGDTMRACDVVARAPCRELTDEAARVSDATWSPVGRQIAYLRTLRGEESGARPGLVRRDAAGREHVLERPAERPHGARFPLAAVWTRRGLAWTTWTLRFDDDSEDFEVLRTATRLLGPDGRTRTITAAAPRGRTLAPFTVASDSPSGEPIGLRYVWSADEGRLALRSQVLRLAADGTRVPWGLTLAGDVGDEGGVEDRYLGMTADGLLAVAHLRVPPADPPPPDDELPPPGETSRKVLSSGDDVSVHLLAPGGTLGPAIAAGPVVSVATPYPNETTNPLG
jgi:hypothetical protein